MNTEQLVEVFNDTVAQVESGKIVSQAVTAKHSSPLAVGGLSEDFVANIQVSPGDSVTVAQICSESGPTAVLNMASPKRPGGGVRNGKIAQEECLFRCSDLYKTMTQEYYPLGYHEGLYTTNATFFKDRNYLDIEPFRADVITVAALNLNPNGTDPIDDVNVNANYEELTLEKIRFIFQLAVDAKVENLVLGAWGCGVYKNNPALIAGYFGVMAWTYRFCFRNIVFAVINDHNSVGNNHDIFKTVIEGYVSKMSQYPQQ